MSYYLDISWNRENRADLISVSVQGIRTAKIPKLYQPMVLKKDKRDNLPNVCCVQFKHNIKIALKIKSTSLIFEYLLLESQNNNLN